MYNSSATQLKPASYKRRGLNYVIDSGCTLLFIYIMTTVTGIIILSFKMLMHIYHVASLQTTTIIFLIEALLVTLLYYIYFEIYGGKTVGKFLSGTKVVMTNGSRLTFSAALKRNIVRFIPFEEWSFVGSDHTFLHDRWSHTKVISDATSPVRGWIFIGVMIIGCIIAFYLQQWMIQDVYPMYLNQANYLLLSN